MAANIASEKRFITTVFLRFVLFKQGRFKTVLSSIFSRLWIVHPYLTASISVYEEDAMNRKRAIFLIAVLVVVLISATTTCA